MGAGVNSPKWYVWFFLGIGLYAVASFWASARQYGWRTTTYRELVALVIVGVLLIPILIARKRYREKHKEDS